MTSIRRLDIKLSSVKSKPMHRSDPIVNRAGQKSLCGFEFSRSLYSYSKFNQGRITLYNESPNKVSTNIVISYGLYRSQ